MLHSGPIKININQFCFLKPVSSPYLEIYLTKEIYMLQNNDIKWILKQNQENCDFANLEWRWSITQAWLLMDLLQRNILVAVLSAKLEIFLHFRFGFTPPMNFIFHYLNISSNFLLSPGNIDKYCFINRIRNLTLQIFFPSISTHRKFCLVYCSNTTWLILCCVLFLSDGGVGKIPYLMIKYIC